MKQFKLYSSIISKEIFQASLVTYLLFLIMETIKPTFVSFFFDLNILLIIVLVSGIIMILTFKEINTPKTFPERFWRYFFRRVSIGKSADIWHNQLRDFKLRKLIKEDWSSLYHDIYKYPKDLNYFGFLERDWRLFFNSLKEKHIKGNDYTFIILTSLIGGGIVYYKTQNIGKISLLISLVTVIIIFLLSILIFTEKD